MAKRLTPEEKVARDLQRKLDRKAEQQAKIAARQAAWTAQRQAEQVAFEASLSEEQKLAISTILVPIGTKVDEFTGQSRDVYESEFIQSLATQLQTWKRLSPAQVAIVVKQHKSKIELQKQLEAWPSVKEGDRVEFLGKVKSLEQRKNDYGCFTKIKIVSHYGREFQVNTTSEKLINIAHAGVESGYPLCVRADVKWVSPDGRAVVLSNKRSQISEL